MTLFGHKKFAFYLQGCFFSIALCLVLSACGGEEGREPPAPGVTVMTLEAKSIPIVGERGDGWIAAGLSSLHSGKNDKIVLPEYGSDAYITTPRK